MPCVVEMVRPVEQKRVPVSIFALRQALVTLVDAGLKKCKLDVWLEESSDEAYFRSAAIDLDQLSPLTHSITLAVRSQLDIRMHLIKKGTSQL